MNINIMAGDMRQHYIKNQLEASNMNALYTYSFQNSDAYVVPVPFTKDGTNLNVMFKEQISIKNFCELLMSGSKVFGGNIPPNVISALSKKQIKCYDFMKDSDIVWQNAYLTAEGLLSQIIETTPFSLKDKNILIIGYGRCGSLIAKLISPLCNNVFIYDHTPNNLHEAAACGYKALYFDDLEKVMHLFHIIINTVPSRELNENHLRKANKICHFYDIASSPFGFDKDWLTKHNLTHFTSPGLPGKYSPETAGELIAKYIINHLGKG